MQFAAGGVEDIHTILPAMSCDIDVARLAQVGDVVAEAAPSFCFSRVTLPPSGNELVDPALEVEAKLLVRFPRESIVRRRQPEHAAKQ